MRILFFGDIHEDASPLDRLADEMGRSDLVVLHGDLTTLGTRERVRAVVEAFRSRCTKLLAQPGNMDPPEVARFLDDEGINLHGRGFRFGEVAIFGVGGSNRTPFRTPTEYSEEEIAACLRSGSEEAGDARVRLLVSHAPPRDTALDRVRSGAHVGSASVREFILREKPDLCVSGHIHEARGEDRLGPTRLFNTGEFSGGGYVAVEMDGAEVRSELRIARG